MNEAIFNTYEIIPKRVFAVRVDFGEGHWDVMFHDVFKPKYCRLSDADKDQLNDSET